MSGSLLEILVSLFLFACILLAYQALAFRGLEETKANAYFSMAEVRVRDLVEHMQIQGDSRVADWQQDNASLLPDSASLLKKQASQYQIQLTWGNFPIPCEVNQIELSGCIKLNFSV